MHSTRDSRDRPALDFLRACLSCALSPLLSSRDRSQGFVLPSFSVSAPLLGFVVSRFLLVRRALSPPLFSDASETAIVFFDTLAFFLESVFSVVFSVPVVCLPFSPRPGRL